MRVEGDGHGESGGHGAGASSERWLLTYSDMITLLMVFFIILYAFSKTDAAKYKAIALSLHAALSGDPLTRGLPNATNNALVTLSPSPAVSQQVGPSAAATLLNQMTEQVQRILQTQAPNEAAASLTPSGLDISFEGDPVYFESASAVLKPNFKQLLQALAPVLKQSPNEIRVMGFTNDLPLHSTVYATAWELSSARAVNVVRYLAEDCGVAPHQLEAVGMGQWHPQYPNDSATNLALNRSVHILVTTDPPPGLDQGGPDVAPPGEGV